MKYGRIIIPVLLSFSLVLSLATMSARDLAIKAESNDIDIPGIVGQYTMDESEFAPEVYTINVATGSLVDSEIESNQEANVQSATEGTQTVTERDWSKYSSDTAYTNMTSAEQQFYSRLTALSQYYMNTSTIDAYYVDAYNTYAINGVKYSDLGLSAKQAFYVAEWFLYNNPQYYFLKPTFLTTSYAIYLGCYDVAYDGDDRADITNELFDNVDYIVDYVASAASTPYETEKCMHDVVCGNLSYVAGTYDQSIYSSMMQGETVCAGYSGMMTVLLNASGIDTLTILSACHAWNEVCLDGAYYAVDTTWDDSLGNYTYFNVNEDNLKRYDSADKEHTYDANFTSWVPVLSEYNYGQTGSIGNDDTVVDVPTVTTEDVDSTSGRIRWTSVSGATAYEISIYSDENYSDLQVCRQTKNYSVKLSNMTAGQTYYFTVRAVKNIDNVDYFSDYVYGSYTCPASTSEEPAEQPAEEETPTPAPAFTIAAPIDLSVIAQTENSAKITWSAVDGAYKYRVEIYSDAAMQSLIASANTSKTTMKLNGMSAGQTVYAKVCSIAEYDGQTYYSDYVSVEVSTLSASSSSDSGQSSDSGESDNGTSSTGSNESGATETPTENTNPEPVQVTVSAPEVTISDLTTTSAKVNWSTIENATSYEFQIYNDDTYTSMIAKKTTTKHRMSLSGLSENGTYYVQVRAIATVDGQDYFSDWTRCTFTTESSTITVATPSNVTCSYVSDTSSKLSWDRVSDTASYEVVIYSDENHSSKLGSISTKKKSLKISGLTSGSTYYVAIRAVENVNGENYYSEWTNVHLDK